MNLSLASHLALVSGASEPSAIHTVLSTNLHYTSTGPVQFPYSLLL